MNANSLSTSRAATSAFASESPPNPTNNANRRLQMVDIARLAGVSTGTVSRALSGSELVKPQTRQRIAELARSLGYSINVGAQNLRLGENNTVGVVIPYDAKTKQHISDPFFLAILGSIADALTDAGYDMLLSRVDSERLDSLAGLHNTGRAKGLIVIGQWGHHDQLNELALRRVPIAVWGAQLAQQLYCTVGSDNLAGGYLATEHLLALGRKHIAFFGDIALPEVALRYEGYVRAHTERGKQPDARLLLRMPFAAEGARVAITDFCVPPVACDAVFAASDLLAMTAISLMLSRGIKVPQDVAMVGYDDVDAASHFHPALSTIRQPIAIAGQVLVDSLMGLVRGEQVASRVLPTELVVRESSQ